jgi:hypothetical protein
MDNCSKEKLETFSKKHYTYINQIFGDATVREIIEENYPTKYVFNLEETGADFEFSYHHTVKTKQRNRVLCSVAKGHQKLHKNFNDTLCQSYSLMNYFGIKIATEKRRKQMAMIKMYRDLLNGTLKNFVGVDFKKIINDEILKDKRNKKLWRNFVTDKGYLNMNHTTLFSNIEDTLNEWESFGYWFFIGKGECPKHSTYSSEMRSQAKLSRELSQEFLARHEMGDFDRDAPRAPTPKPKSMSKSKSKSMSKSKSKSKSKTMSKSKSKSKTMSKSKSKSSSKSKTMKHTQSTFGQLDDEMPREKEVKQEVDVNKSPSILTKSMHNIFEPKSTLSLNNYSKKNTTRKSKRPNTI